MRPTTGVMLQQNNNNNYPCLNSTREALHPCSAASLPVPSRLELGLGDLPLVRGLRAWALYSKNRCKAAGLLGGGQPPVNPPVGHRGSASCPRPADVHLSGEWARLGYGLPLGLDATQTGIGALVTVATLKTSEGTGKTQTQCLVLRTEKGSCLYSTAKPGSGPTRSGSTASSGVGGWLRGRTGAGHRDAAAGRKDNVPNLPAQPGANRVRVRSGRRWRKSGNAAGREKPSASKEGEERTREGPAGERQEEQDNGGRDGKQFLSLQQDGSRARSPTCCHGVCPTTCPQCGGRTQRRQSQDGGQSPRGEAGSACLLDDLESFSCRDGEEMKEADGDEETTSHSVDDVRHDKGQENPLEDESEDQTKRVKQEVEKPSVGQTPVIVSPVSNCYEDVISQPASVTTAVSPEASAPAGGSTFSGDQEACWVRREQEENLEGRHPAEVTGEEEPTEKPEHETVVVEAEEIRRKELADKDKKAETSVSTAGEDSYEDNKKTDSGAADNRRRRDSTEPNIIPVTENKETRTNLRHAASADPSIPANPDPSLPPLGSMATGPAALKEEGEQGGQGAVAGDGGQEEKRRTENQKEEERGFTLASADERKEEEEEFGAFLQAEGKSAWSDEVTASASVHCGSRGSDALRNHSITADLSQWTPDWTENSSHQSDTVWTAFPQDSSDEVDNISGQWWPSSAAEDRRDGPPANHNLTTVFAEAFPSLSDSSSRDPYDLDTVPTLTELLRDRARPDQGLLDTFHDLNKMIVQRYKRASGTSHNLLLTTLHLRRPQTGGRPASWTANRRLSPGLPSANQHAQNAAAKRRLSYDDNRNVME